MPLLGVEVCIISIFFNFFFFFCFDFPYRMTFFIFVFFFILSYWFTPDHQTRTNLHARRFNKEFEEAYDLYEVQRVLNNVFSYDLVPAPETLLRALQACRRVNDYPTAVRVFEGLKVKVENKQQYQQYLDELKDVRQELGVDLAEDL